MKLDRYQITSYIIIMGMEVCWLYAWLELLHQKATSGAVAVLPLLLIYPVAFVVNRLLQRLSWRRIIIDIVSWIIWTGVMLLMVRLQLYRGLALVDPFWIEQIGMAFRQIFTGLRPELFILFSSIPLWWLGRHIARIQADFTDAVTGFQFGIAIMVAAFFSAGQMEITIASGIPVIVIFVALGLLGMAIAHAQEGKSWLSGISQGHWPALLVGSVALVIIAGLLVSFLVTPDLLQVFLSAVKWVWGLIGKVLWFLVNLIPIGDSGPVEAPVTPGIDQSGEAVQEIGRRLLPENVRKGISIALGVIMLVSVLAALWQVSSQIADWLRSRRGTSGAETRSLHGAFRVDLRNLIRKIWRRLFRLTSLFRAKKRRREAVAPEVATVHQIYHQLLRWAAGSGYPRQTAQTPHEYLVVLTNILPGVQEDLSRVTGLYVSTRYGSFLPTEGEMAQIKQSWSNIKHGGKR